MEEYRGQPGIEAVVLDAELPHEMRHHQGAAMSDNPGETYLDHAGYAGIVQLSPEIERAGQALIAFSEELATGGHIPRRPPPEVPQGSS